MFIEITTIYHSKHIMNTAQITTVNIHNNDEVVINFSNGDSFRVTKEQFDNNIKERLYAYI